MAKAHSYSTTRSQVKSQKSQTAQTEEGQRKSKRRGDSHLEEVREPRHGCWVHMEVHVVRGTLSAEPIPEKAPNERGLERVLAGKSAVNDPHRREGDAGASGGGAEVILRGVDGREDSCKDADEVRRVERLLGPLQRCPTEEGGAASATEAPSTWRDERIMCG